MLLPSIDAFTALVRVVGSDVLNFLMEIDKIPAWVYGVTCFREWFCKKRFWTIPYTRYTLFVTVSFELIFPSVSKFTSKTYSIFQ